MTISEYKPCILIVSLKYAPGLKKEFALLGEQIQQHNMQTKYLLSSSYAHLSDVPIENTHYLTTSDSLASALQETVKHLASSEELRLFMHGLRPRLVLIYNFHPLNYAVLSLAKSVNPNCITAWYLHEPYKPDKSLYSVQQRIVTLLMEQYQAVAMALVDHVILPSQYARRLFPKRYRQYAGQLHTAPLLIKDRISHAGSDNQRSTFSYVGRIHAGTGFSDFINLINYTASVNSDKTFIIVTSSSTKSYLKRLNPKAFNHLTIVNAPIILDSHIDLALSKSIATFRLDRDITQSGVVPVSYMHGTPVIARDLPGFAQHVDHGRNGYLVKRDFLEQDLLTAMRYVEEHRESLVWSARSSYEAMWSPTHWLEHYKWLLDAVN